MQMTQKCKSVIFYLTILTLLISCSNNQPSDSWSKVQIEYRNTFLKFCKDLDSRKESDLDSNSVTLKTIIQKYINVRKDVKLDSVSLVLFSYLIKDFHHTIDSIGSKNLDAKPITYFKKNKDFYKPFTGNLKPKIPDVLAYYHKKHPNKPIATILLDQKSHKIIS